MSEPPEFAWLDKAAALDNPEIDVHAVTTGLRQQRQAGDFFHRGYPVATDTWDELKSLDLGPGLWNNIGRRRDRKSTRLNSSHPSISYAVFCLKKKKRNNNN